VLESGVIGAVMPKTTLSKNPRSPFYRLRFYDPRTRQQVTRTSKISDHSEAAKTQTLLRQASKMATLTGNFSVFDNLVNKVFGLDELVMMEVPTVATTMPETKEVITWDEFLAKTFKAKGNSKTGGWTEVEGFAFLRGDKEKIKTIHHNLMEEQRKGLKPRFKVRHLEDVCYRIGSLTAFFGKRNMLELTPKDVSAFIDHRKNKEGVSGSTINRETCCLNNLFKYAEVIEGFEKLRNPYNSLLHKQSEPKPHISIWLDNMKRDFLEACESMGAYQGFPLTLLSDVAVVNWTVGCRIDELLSLKVNQVQLSEGILVLSDWTTKNSKFRNVHMRSDQVMDILRRNMEGKGKDELVFSWSNKGNRGKGDNQIRYNAFQKAFQAVCLEAGIRGQKIHNWRKTAVTVQMFALDGLSETEIMVEMQWSDTRLLNSYLDRPLAVQLRKQHLRSQSSAGIERFSTSSDLAYAL
jgi:integrase